MTPRENEARLLADCVAVARKGGRSANDRREAYVFQLAAMIIGPQFSDESRRLMQASSRYFVEHPGEERPTMAEAAQKGWVSSLPRLRNMLEHHLNEEQSCRQLPFSTPTPR